jgi:hypothetical protein
MLAVRKASMVPWVEGRPYPMSPVTKKGSAWLCRSAAPAPLKVRSRLPVPAHTGTIMPTLNRMAVVWSHHASGLKMK